MANKRNLKKSINYLCGELLAECMTRELLAKKELHERLEEVAVEILDMQCDMLSRVCCPEPGMKQKDYYKALTRDLGKRAQDILDKLNAINSEAK